MHDYNEIYHLSIFSVFHEIMLRAKRTSRNDDRISTFRGSLQGGPYCTNTSNCDPMHFTMTQCGGNPCYVVFFLVFFYSGVDFIQYGRHDTLHGKSTSFLALETPKLL